MKSTRFFLIAVAVAGLAILAWAGASPDRPVGAGSRPAPASLPTTSSQPAHAGRPRGAAKPKARRDPAPPTIAHIRLDGEVLEGPPALLWLPDDHYMTLQDWLQRLAKARQDKEIAAVALDIDAPGLSWAQAQELADAVARLSAVKPVYAFLNSPTAADHLVASGCKEVSMDPADTLTLLGVGVEMLYFRGTLDKLGITPQFVQIGSFKGASEPFSQTQPSAEVKQMYGWLLDDLYDQLLGQLAQHRRLTHEQAREAVDAGILSAAEAKRLRLVDRVVEKADWEATVEGCLGPRDQDIYWEDDYGCKKEKGLDLTNPFAMLGTLMKGRKPQEPRDPTIAIVCAEGVITEADDEDDFGLFREPGISAATLVRTFTDLECDGRVKAVILRIDSPGGSALASEHIYQAVRRCAEAKPVIVSIGGMGASGGYYIACGGTTILADPASLVGSIGVVSGKIALTGLLDKIGVSRFELTRGAKAGLEMLRPWTKEEEAVIRKHAQLTYETFLQRVKDSRGRKVPKVEEVAGGRVFTARQAKEKGLVDRLGGLRDAVLAAQDAAGLKEAHFITLPRPRSILDLLLGGGEQASAETSGRLAAQALSAATDPSAAILRKLAGRRERAAASYLLSMARLLGREKVLAAMPGYLSIHW